MFSPSHWATFHLLLQKLAKLFYFTTAYNIVFLKNVLKKKTGKILEQVNFFLEIMKTITLQIEDMCPITAEQHK